MPGRLANHDRAPAAPDRNPALSLEEFRSQLGLPPIRYLAAWRMHVATDLLASTTLSVTAVARRVGYESEEAFSRAFKRHLGKPPGEFRAHQ